MSRARTTPPADGNGLSGPISVEEGGTIEVEVASGADELVISNGDASWTVPVEDGKAKIELAKRGVKAGAVLVVSDRLFPDPSEILVEVVAGD